MFKDDGPNSTKEISMKMLYELKWLKVYNNQPINKIKMEVDFPKGSFQNLFAFLLFSIKHKWKKAFLSEKE